jgi:hypothetical protein
MGAFCFKSIMNLIDKILEEANQGISAIKFWTNGGYKMIQSISSGLKKDDEEAKRTYGNGYNKYKKDGKALYQSFVNILSKLKPYNGTLYRGIVLKNNQLQKFLVQYKKGNTITFPFSSATKNEAYGKEKAYTGTGSYYPSTGILFIIQSKTARDITRYAAKDWKWQSEAVILDKTQFKVTNVKSIKKESRIDVYLQEI